MGDSLMMGVGDDGLYPKGQPADVHYDDIFWNPGDTYYVGYDSGGAVCGRPRDVLVSRRITIGGTATNYNPLLELWDGDGAGCPVGSVGAYLQGHFFQNIFGITTPVELRAGAPALTAYPLMLTSYMADGAGNISIYMFADVNVANINATHEILKLLWINNADVNQDAYSFRYQELQIHGANQAQVVGTSADGGAAVGVQIGSDNAFVTAGARLVEWINNVTVRGFLDYEGDLGFNMLDNGQQRTEETLSELTTIAAAAFTDTTIQIPADAQVIACSVRVTVTIPTAATFDVGIAGAVTRYGTALNVAAGTTHPGCDDGVRYYAAATAIRISPNLVPANNNGRVRVTIHFRQITPPTS